MCEPLIPTAWGHTSGHSNEAAANPDFCFSIICTAEQCPLKLSCWKAWKGAFKAGSSGYHKRECMRYDLYERYGWQECQWRWAFQLLAQPPLLLGRPSPRATNLAGVFLVRRKRIPQLPQLLKVFRLSGASRQKRQEREERDSHAVE